MRTGGGRDVFPAISGEIHGTGMAPGHFHPGSTAVAGLVARYWDTAIPTGQASIAVAGCWMETPPGHDLQGTDRVDRHRCSGFGCI